MLEVPQGREREVIEVATWTPAQRREVWPELMAFILDPCSAALVGGLTAQQNDETVRAERYRRLKAKREIQQEMRMERPR